MSANTKIVFLVMDGLGGLPREEGGKTELETAHTPNLDSLANRGICGLQQPVGAGITPGSGPSHIGLFGYPPLEYDVGRGVLSALGIDFDLQHTDVAARGNYCTLDENGVITDRRAGRISTEIGRELSEILDKITIPGAEVFIRTEKEYRFLFVLRGENLSGEIHDTDPQHEGMKPSEPFALVPEADHTAELIKAFVKKASEAIKDRHPANGFLLRGFAKYPVIPKLSDIYKLRTAAIAAYPMYRGVARLVGMDILPTAADINDEFDTLEKYWNDYDFFYFHVKRTDSFGEDGNFDKKVGIIEEVDRNLPRLFKLNPDVIVVTGDHSTPSVLKSHSWHPVPTLLYSKYCRPDSVKKFGERDCMLGSLGANFPSHTLMPLTMANALRLEKYGA